MQFSNLMIRMASLLALVLMAIGPALAQSVNFESLLLQREITCLLEHENKVLGGLDGGGLLIWDRENPALVENLFAGNELSGNDVTALCWTGENIWVATLGGGLTRINNLTGEPNFRQFTSNIGSLNITAVTGQVIGSSERVYYGMQGAGVGLITDGLGGAIYTAEQDGLIDNNINDLQIYDGELFVATPSGVSKFSNNLFTDENAGLSSLVVRQLALDQNGDLVCGGNGGIYRWNPGTESWDSLNWTSGWVVALSANDSELWAIGKNSLSEGLVGHNDGSGWQMIDAPQPQTYALFAGQDLWVGGRWQDSEMNSGASGFAFYAEGLSSGQWQEYMSEASLVFNGSGLTIDADGRTWVGSHGGNAVSGMLGDDVSHIYNIASVANDSTGLFNHASNMLTMAADHQGLVYTGQYTSGIVRHDTNTDETDLIWGANSGLGGGFIIKMITHPDGSLIVMHDWADAQKVEILTDPLHWRSDDNWLDVPQGSEGIGAGIGVWDALVERNDVIWFAVEGSGLVRWDINGYSNGPDDEITWHDLSDDQWVGPISNIPGTSNDPALAVALDMAPDGTLWFGGNGVTRISYDEVFGDVELVEDFSAKTASYQVGLITGNVTDLATDSNGDLWVTTSLGLNRIHWGLEDPLVDAYFDLGNYLSNSTYGELYSFNVISALPGGQYRRVETNADGTRMALSSTMGAVAWDITATGVEPENESLSAMFFYPNPWVMKDQDSSLKLGGISADADNDDPALVEVYNLEGQLVYRNSLVSAGTGFWDGKNRVGNPVTSGMYVVKVTWRGLITTRSVALVR